MTLKDSIELLREENAQVATNTGEMKESIGELVEFFRGSALDAEEERRERAQGAGTPTPVPTSAVPQKSPDVESEMNLGGILKTLVAIPTAILGFVTGMYSKVVGDIGKTFLKITKVIIDEFKLLGTFVGEKFKFGGGIFKGITESFKNIVMNVKMSLSLMVDSIKNKLKPISNIAKSIKSGFETFYINYLLFKDKVSAFFKPVGDAIDNVVKAFKGVSDTTSKAGGILSKITEPVKKFFTTVKNFAGGMFKAFSGLGRILGWPVTVLMGVFEGIKQSMDSFKAGDLLGGTMQFITGFINGALLSVVDLIKDGISWLASKLGFENFSAMLDGFNFTESFTVLMEKFTVVVKNIFSSIGSMFTNIKEYITGLFESEDHVGYLMEPINQMIQDIKDFVLGMIPSMDGITQMAKSGLSSVGNFFGMGDDESEIKNADKRKQKDQIAPTSDVPNFASSDVPNFVSSATTNTTNNTNNTTNNVSNMEKRIEIAQRAVEIAERGVAKDPASASKQQILEKRIATVQKLEQRIEKPVTIAQVEKLQTNNETSVIERPTQTMRTINGEQAVEQSKENAQMKAQASAVNVVSAPQVSTTNNNQSTAAILDKNMPTVDYNDRSFSI